MRYDAILFDMDGTVVDSLQDIADAVNHTLRSFGEPERSREEVRRFVGNGAEALIRRVLPPDAEEAYLQRVLAAYLPWYAAHCADRTRPFDGVVPLLRRLRKMGLKTAVISNKPDAAAQGVAEAFFPELFDLTVGERPGVRRKPAPDMLQDAAARLGTALPRCLYVGDSEVDVETAKNAGIDCAAVSWGFRAREELERAGAKHIIDTPEALERFITEAQP